MTDRTPTQQDLMPLVIYHANCVDGFTAAWVADRALRRQGADDVELFAAQHGNQPPDVTGRDVYIVDFSYARDLLLQMRKVARSIVVLDHHKTAQEALAGLDFCIFDMDRSGAGLAWWYFHEADAEVPDTPALVRYVQDRDLWTFALSATKVIHAWLLSFDFDLVTWDDLASKLEHIHGHSAAIHNGRAILRAKERQVAKSCLSARIVTLDGHTFPAVNCPVHISDVAGQLALESELGMAACWFQALDGGIVWSLRSRGEDAPDVSAIAVARGGGGHRNEAGFRVTLAEHVEILGAGR